MVWGLGGLGKTSLIRALFSDRDRRLALEVRPVPGAGLSALVEAVGRSWSTPTKYGQRDDDDCDGAASALLDLAEARGASIFVDDAHRLGAADVARLMNKFAKFADRGRLLLSSRVMPEVPDLAESFLRLEPLAPASVGELVRACRPAITDAECARLVSASSGSPWTARCLATGETGVHATLRMFDDLDAAATRALGVLRWIDGPIQDDLLDRIVGTRGSGRQLEGRAFADRTSEGLRLHDVARDHLEVMAPPDRALGELALEHLQQGDDCVVAFAALSLATALGDHSALESIASRHGERLLQAGLAGASFQAMAAAPPAVAVGFRLASAARSGGRLALAWAAAQPVPEGDEARLEWAECLIACARAGEARGHLAAMALAAPAKMAQRAALAYCRTVRSEAEAGDALALLALPHIAAAPSSALQMSMEARALVYAQRYDEAVRLAEVACQTLEAEAHPSPVAACMLFSLLNSLGRHASASTVLRTDLGPRELATLTHSQLYELAMHCLETGDLARAGSFVSCFAKLDGGHDQTRFLLCYLQFRLAWVSGDASKARRLRHEMADIARVTGRADYRIWTRIVTLQLAIADEAEPTSDDRPGDTAPRGFEGLLLEILERLALARAGRTVETDDLEIPEAALDVVALGAQLRAEQQASLGRLPAARAMLQAARSRVGAQRGAIWEMELLAAEGRLCRRAGLSSEAADLGRELERRGLECRALRYVSMGRALSGVVIDEVRVGGLTLDRGRRVARTADGRTVDLEQHELGFRILEQLIDQGGRISKEQLAMRVWELRTYDPSRDDKRLQMAIRRLRLLLERDPASPRIVVTSPQGYALGEG